MDSESSDAKAFRSKARAMDRDRKAIDARKAIMDSVNAWRLTNGITSLLSIALLLVGIAMQQEISSHSRA